MWFFTVFCDIIWKVVPLCGSLLSFVILFGRVVDYVVSTHSNGPNSVCMHTCNDELCLSLCFFWVLPVSNVCAFVFTYSVFVWRGAIFSICFCVFLAVLCNCVFGCVLLCIVQMCLDVFSAVFCNCVFVSGCVPPCIVQLCVCVDVGFCVSITMAGLGLQPQLRGGEQRKVLGCP